MKSAFVLFLLIVPFQMQSSSAISQEYKRKSVNVTVYNNNLGVVRDVREIDLKSGNSEIKITDVAEKIDPTSVNIKFNGSVLEQNYQYDLVSLTKILTKYIDKEITLVGESTISGKLLSVTSGSIVLQNNIGGLTMLPKIDDYKISVGSLPEGLITKPTLVWMLNSKSSGKQDIELSYQTSDMNWHAEYVVVLNQSDTKADLNSWVSVENRSGTTFPDAKLKLVAGDINLVQPQYDVKYTMGRAKDYSMAEEFQPQFQEKEFFEYHIYDLQRNTTIANNEIKQISLFEAKEVNVIKKYLYRSGRYFAYFNESGNKVAVVVEFENKKENNLGLPLPKGKVRLYKSNGKSLEFVGEDMIEHTPKDEKVKLKVGDAFDIVAEEIEKDYKKISDKVHEYVYQIKLKNRKSEDITVECEKYLGLGWEIIEESMKHEKKDAKTILYKVPVKKDKEEILEFKVRFTY